MHEGSVQKLKSNKNNIEENRKKILGRCTGIYLKINKNNQESLVLREKFIFCFLAKRNKRSQETN